MSVIYIPGVLGDGSAGVGVMNVKPNFSDIEIKQIDDSMRVYLTISDYNSWRDIFKVQVRLMGGNDETLGYFVFQQYEDVDKYDEINLFYEGEESSLLNMQACDATHSDESVSVVDRCHLELRFVFTTTFFSKLSIIVEDRAGDTAETMLEYAGGGIFRDENTIHIPWVDGTIKIHAPAMILDGTILFTAVLSTIYIGKKSSFSTTLTKVFYEQK